jgi:Na+-driven multidrug efflux pump
VTNGSTLRLSRPTFSGRALLRICTNGSSEVMSNISMSLIGMLFNVQLLRYAGQNGVAAYGVLMYVNMIFLAVFIGFSIGTAPIIGFHYGAQNNDELKGILKKSLQIIAVFSGCMLASALLLAKPLTLMFVGYDAGPHENDAACLFHLFVLFPVFRICDLWLRFFYGAERRSGLGRNFLHADARLRDGRHSALSEDLGR